MTIEQLNLLLSKLIFLDRQNKNILEIIQHTLYLSEGEDNKLDLDNVNALIYKLKSFKNLYSQIIEAIDFQEIRSAEVERFIEDIKNGNHSSITEH